MDFRMFHAVALFSIPATCQVVVEAKQAACVKIAKVKDNNV
jgi:hypothetical protein